MSLDTIKREFRRLTLLPLPTREINRLGDKVHRKDSVFPLLSNKIFDHPRLLQLLKKKIQYWVRLDDSETLLALAGYIYYLDDNFANAEKYFYRCIDSESENIDSWVDLVFSLYHQNDKKNGLAKAILFDLDLFIKFFKSSKHGKCSFTILGKIYKSLKENKKDYSHTWQKYTIQEK